jgi:antitoxin (DNA-binding transcriptional repressor) of toxin-antitoxin stability system
MQIGVRELKGRLSEVVNGNRPVVVTKNGKIVGEYTPATIIKPTADRAKWLDERVAFRLGWQKETPNWVDLLMGEGMDGEGEMFDEPTFR